MRTRSSCHTTFYICKILRCRRTAVASLFSKCHPSQFLLHPENEADAIFLISPLRLYHSTRQRYALKTSRELVYVQFQRFSLELHTWTLNGAISSASSVSFLVKCVVYRSIWFAPPSFLRSYGKVWAPSNSWDTGVPLRKTFSRKNQKSGRGRSTVLMCGACGIIIDAACIPSLAVVQYLFDATNRTVSQHH